MRKQEERHRLVHDELPTEHEDRLIGVLHLIIRYSVKLLAILMALVIMWGVADVVFVIYQRLSTAPQFLLGHNDLFDVFGAFMMVLIAIEIFINIRLYLGSNVIPIQLVIATALMAISRKVIVMDLDDIEAMDIFAIGTVVFALGVTYWLLANKEIKYPG